MPKSFNNKKSYTMVQNQLLKKVLQIKILLEKYLKRKNKFRILISLTKNKYKPQNKTY